MEFGEQLRKEFDLEDDITFINHGGYGAVPRRVKEAQRRLTDEMDRNPDLWFRQTKKLKIDEARHCVAEFVGSDPDDVVFVQNATTGINAVMKSIKLESDDMILCTDHTYEAVKNTCKKVSSSSGAQVIFLTIEFPIKSEDDVIEMFRQYFMKNQKVKIAVFDHISSSSAIRWPIEKLIPLCRDFGVLSLIDGAHAPGQIPLNMRELDPDFYIGNLHKWLFCPRGCAIMYVKRIHQDWVEPAVTGHGYKTTFQNDFLNQGTQDETSFMVVPEAIKFYRELGGYEKIKNYAENVIKEATDRMTSTWGTQKIAIPESMEAPFMKLVQLPETGMTQNKSQGRLSRDEQNALLAYFIQKYRIVASFSRINGVYYHRPHCYVYNTKKDYIKMIEEIENQRK